MTDQPSDQNLTVIPDAPGGPSEPEYPTAGQPTKLNPKRQARFCRLLKEGNYLETAAYGCGVTPQTIYNWLNVGYAQDSGAERKFFDAVKLAAAQAEIDALKTAKAGAQGWQSAAWFLERRYPTRYARREFVYDSRDLREATEEQLENMVAEALEVKQPSIEVGGDSWSGAARSR